MRWSWRIGTIAGIGVYIHATFLLLILFILGVYLHQGRTLEGALAGVLFILVIFGCIVLRLTLSRVLPKPAKVPGGFNPA